MRQMLYSGELLELFVHNLASAGVNFVGGSGRVGERGRWEHERKCDVGE